MTAIDIEPHQLIQASGPQAELAYRTMFDGAILADASILAYSRKISAFLDWAQNQGRKHLTEISNYDCGAYLNKIFKDGKAPSTINLHASSLSFLMRQFQAKGIELGFNHIESWSTSKDTESKPIQPFSHDELHAFFGSLAGNDLKAARDQAMFLLMFAFAVGTTEVRNLDMEDCLAKPNGKALIVFGNRKETSISGRNKIVAEIPPEVRAPLGRYLTWLPPEIKGAMFFGMAHVKKNQPQKPLSARSIRRVFEDYVAAAGIPKDRGLSPGSLRVSGLLADYATNKDVERIRQIGHFSDESGAANFLRRYDGLKLGY